MLKSVLGAPQTSQEAVERARSLFPLIRSQARAADEARRLPRELIDAFTETGLVRILVPRRWGGSELGMIALMDAAIELGRASGSMGWVSSFLMEHPLFIAQMDPRTQADVWEGPDGPDTRIATSFAPSGNVTPADGGWLLSGNWSWASGVDHCSWILLGGLVARAEGALESRLFLVPTSETEIIDTWFSAGMKASGSNDVVLDSVFVPDHRTLLMSSLREGEAPGAAVHENALYRTPMMAHAGSPMVAPAIGAALGVVDAWRDHVQAKTHAHTHDQVAAAIPMQLCLAEASTQIDCADMLVRRALELVDSGCPISLEDRIRSRRDITYATRLLTAATNDLMGMAGANALRDDSPIQRGWRDVRAMSCHVFCDFNRGGENYARTALGFPVNPRDPFF